VKGDGDERAEAREGEGGFLVANPGEGAAEEIEGEGDPGRDAEEGPQHAARDEELEEISMGRLDEAVQLPGLDDPERLPEGAEAGAEDRVALPGFERVRPEEDARIGPEVARVGREEAEERAGSERRGGEEDGEEDAAREDEAAAREERVALSEAPSEGEAGEEEGRGGGREYPSPRVGEGQGRGEEGPEEDADGPGGQAVFDGRHGHRTALAATRVERNDEAPERDREADAEVPGEVVGVEERAGDAARLLLRGDGPDRLDEHARQEDGGEGPAPGAGDEEGRSGEERGRVCRGEERDGARLERGDGDAGNRRRDAGGGKDLGGATVDSGARRRDRLEEPGGKGHELKEPEERHGQEARRRHEDGDGRGCGTLPPESRGRGREERQELYAESARRLDGPEGKRRRGCETEKKEEPRRVRRIGPEACGILTKPVMKLQRLALLAVLPAAILWAAAPADDFYLLRLQAGKAEAAAGRHYDAIDDFRIASFGFLDQPALLAEGLVRLALAQSAAGQADATDATLRRYVEVERAYGGWAGADLEPGARAAFTALVGKRLGAETAKLFAVTPPAPTPTPTSAPAPASTPSPTAPVATTPAAGPDGTGASATVLAESRALVGQGRYVENLRKLVAAVAASPKDRDLRKALLEGASLTKDWSTATAQLEFLRPFQDGEEPWMFYAAVALQETGLAAEARELAERALPKLNRSPFVDFYARKILESPPKR